MANLIVADPIRIPGPPNVMCHSWPCLVNGVGAEIRAVTVKCSTKFCIRGASRIFRSKGGKVLSHDMCGHVAAAVIDKQARHFFAQWVLDARPSENSMVSLARGKRWSNGAGANE